MSKVSLDYSSRGHIYELTVLKATFSHSMGGKEGEGIMAGR
jgi:hypothetical protein